MKKTRFDVIADIAGADDWQHDPFGTATGLFFPIAEVLDMSDIEGDVTLKPFARWQYHPSPLRVPALETVAARASDFAEGEFADDYSYATVMLANALESDQITQSDLIYAGDVLNKYIALLERNGKRY